MIKGNYNPVESERKKNEKLQFKKQQLKKIEQRKERLTAYDPIRTLKQISYYHNLSKSGTISEKQSKHLVDLEGDVKFMEKHGLHKEKIEQFKSEREKYEKQKIERQTRSLGTQSVFFDPEWNPSGKVPVIEGKNIPNITYPINHQSKFYKEYNSDSSILKIPLPVDPPPRFYKCRNSQVMYQSEEVKVDLSKITTSGLIPTNILKKRADKKKEQATEQAAENTNIKNEHSITSDDYNENYASEEEEYLIRIGKLPSKKSKTEMETED